MKSSLANFRFLAVALVSTIAVSSVDFKVTGQGPAQAQPRTVSRQEVELSMLRSMSANVRQVASILRENSLEIDASLLFTISGRKKLRPRLNAIPDMNMLKVHTGSLGGLVLAHDLTLPEQTFLDADTVIIANNVIFTGKDPDVSGPHAFHMFALDSVLLKNGDDTVVTIDTSGFAGEHRLDEAARNRRKDALLTDSLKIKNSDPNVIKIDTSGGRKDGLEYGAPPSAAAAGYDGSSGESGVTGVAAKSGLCDTDKNGGTGEPGTGGLPGSKGGDGANGTDGGDAHPQTIMIGSITGGYFRSIAKGGRGGEGGAGGRGGDGGKGGNGGPGGNGVACKCSWDGLGEGGTGGTSGAGGAGGEGGIGGNGGAGGDGASIAIIVPGPYFNRVKQYSGAGSAGRGGRGGLAGKSGPPGTPGVGGTGGALTGCGEARNGNQGSHANSAASGNHGRSGEWGKNGDPGSLSFTFSDEKSW